ncbi:MAG: bifunctional 5,10-methylenetetrahydrofolate dehydrogenase/5,10-methenyltetrahydrofolate cyclohydrolase [Eggerthellaceae bacterium]|nr:bifunctional 5,10-methylenetetrahydrofolate dehydrogenase/5,10-methenyltetrahydrofolate cyclohydrolase [Eggerthellaceae bacterium]
MADLLRGKPVADLIKRDIKTRVDDLKSRGIEPTLAVLRVGERSDDVAYESSILKSANLLGINVNVFAEQGSITTDELISIVDDINEDESIHGCLIFRPLPEDIDEVKVCNRLASEKDIDCCGAESLAGVFMDLPEGFAPATATACIEMLAHNDVALSGAKVVVVGRSLVIGKPVAMLALKENATVVLCHSKTSDLAGVMRDADVVICATGKAKMFHAQYFSPGQVVLDVGMNVDSHGLLCGDVDTDDVVDVVRAITPVPGGIGGVTTAVLLRNVVDAAERAEALQS